MKPEIIALGSLFGALIGYLANRLAIWMLFHPIKPVKIGPLTLQGIFPKKKGEIAEKLASVISETVVTKEEIAGMTKEAVEKMISSVKLPFSGPVSSLVEGVAKSVMLSLAQKFLSEASDHIDVAEYVRRKFDEIDDEEFERMFKEAIGNELKYISLNDAMIGAIVGALEAMIMSLVH